MKKSKEMSFAARVLSNLFWAFLVAFSYTPFWVMHRLSDFLYLFVYYGIKYRRTVVRENLVSSFPEKSIAEIITIEKKFYLGFTDLIFETIKTISISKEKLAKRFQLTTPVVTEELYKKGVNLVGISGHLGTWEWLALSLQIVSKQQLYGLYAPLSNTVIDAAMKKNRSRFGTIMLRVKSARELYLEIKKAPYIIGLFSDQAPRHYERSFEIQFLNQQTFVVAGPGIMMVEKDLTPFWGWTRRVGRSRYVWGLQLLERKYPAAPFAPEDRAQIDRIAKTYDITQAQAASALELTRDFNQILEQQIKMAPQDWLWSHRRWKKR